MRRRSAAFFLGAMLAALPWPSRAQVNAGCQCADGSANPSCDRNVCCQRMFGRNCDSGGAGMGAFIPAGGDLQQQVGFGLMNAAISGFINGMFSQQAYPDPAREAERQRVLELERQQQAERDAERRRKFIADRDDLLQKLMGRKFMDDLKFKALNGPASKELGFKDLGAGRGDRGLAERQKVLQRLKGKPEEAWCADHVTSLLCPKRPSYELGKLYESRLAHYRAMIKEWDAKCGGPSTQPGYKEKDLDDCGDPAQPQPGASTLNFMPMGKGPEQPPQRREPGPVPEKKKESDRIWRNLDGISHPPAKSAAPQGSADVQRDTGPGGGEAQAP